MIERDIVGVELDACLNPACLRKTTAMYCCGSCDRAHQGRYEIHEEGPLAHLPSCDERNRDRGEYTPYGASERRSAKKRRYEKLLIRK